jgi:hypothetical protein
MSGLLFERAPAGWRRYDPPEAFAGAAGSLRTLDLSRSYQDQKDALKKRYERTGTDVFVATFALRKPSTCARSNPILVHLVRRRRDPASQDRPRCLEPRPRLGKSRFTPRALDHRRAPVRALLETHRRRPAALPRRGFPTNAEWTSLQAASGGADRESAQA